MWRLRVRSRPMTMQNARRTSRSRADPSVSGQASYQGIASPDDVDLGPGTKLPGMISDVDRAALLRNFVACSYQMVAGICPRLDPIRSLGSTFNKFDVSMATPPWYSAFIMRKAGVARTDPALKAAAWLKQNPAASGRWVHRVGRWQRETVPSQRWLSITPSWGLAELGEPLEVEKPKPIASK